MASAGETLELTERDEAGVVTATYVLAGQGSVEVVRPHNGKSFAQQVLDVFLPAGYPHSVTDDYIQYQIYDSLQAFSSSIAGLLASRAVLEGVGVGDASASPTAALLLSVLQESMGRIATILFAHRLGTSLEPECKMYRLAADVLNDAAMVLDCLSPAFPKAIRVPILSFSSVLRSLCGVCAGSSKASLSAHFAKRGNLGELNAKDSSQETVISLLGMLTGSFVVSWVSSPLATWTTLMALLSIHLAMNYAAVKAVRLRVLNRQRANIVLSNVLSTGRVLSPAQVAQRERIFEHDGVLRWADDRIIGHCSIGVSLERLLTSLRLSLRTKRGGGAAAGLSLQGMDTQLSDLVRLYEHESYILWSPGPASEAIIILKQGCTPISQLQAWAHALVLARQDSVFLDGRSKPGGHVLSTTISSSASASSGERLAALRTSLAEAQTAMQRSEGALRAAGWALEAGVLETRASKRVEVGSAASWTSQSRRDKKDL